MKCPSCKGRTEVLDSRESSYGVIRKRHCLKCDARFTTVEGVALDVNISMRQINRTKNDLERLQESIDSMKAVLDGLENRRKA